MNTTPTSCKKVLMNKSHNTSQPFHWKLPTIVPTLIDVLKVSSFQSLFYQIGLLLGVSRFKNTP